MYAPDTVLADRTSLVLPNFCSPFCSFARILIRDQRTRGRIGPDRTRLQSQMQRTVCLLVWGNRLERRFHGLRGRAGELDGPSYQTLGDIGGGVSHHLLLVV